MPLEKHVLPRLERHNINITNGDFAILMVYADMEAIGIQHCLHNMIVVAKCWEEQHVDRLQLAEDRATSARKQSLELTNKVGELQRRVRSLTAKQRQQ